MNTKDTNNTGIHTSKNEYRDSSIVFIFNNYKKIKSTYEVRPNFFLQMDEPFIKMWDNFHSHSILPQEKRKDTMVFIPINGTVLFQHKIDFFTEKNIILKKGDTVKIDYEESFPIISVTNRVLPSKEFIIDSVLEASQVHSSEYSNLDCYMYPILTLSGKTFNTHEISENKLKYGKSAISDLSHMKVILDSLYYENKITKESHSFFLDKLYFLSLSIRCNINELTELECLKVFDSIRTTNILESYRYSINFSEEYVYKYIHPKFKMIKGSNSVNSDYKSIYEEIATSQIFPTRIKELLLYKYLNLIGKNYPIATFKTIAKNFENIAKDSFLINNINTAFFLDFDKLRIVSDSVYLIDQYKKITTLKNILSKNNNKVIYIDFWASWCLPCLRLLPASKNLSSLYNQDKLAVLYLSIDKNYEDWRKAASKNGLLQSQNSYLIVNPNTAAYLTKLKLSEIPRYLLYDKKGELIYDYAPHPDDKNIKSIIDRLILKNH